MKLRTWQKAQGLTNEQLAEKLGVHWTTVYGWFSGSRFPSRKKALHIEKVTGGAVRFKEAMFPRK